MSLNDEWSYFLQNNTIETNKSDSNIDNFSKLSISKNIIPEASDIYISTKTKIVYLNVNTIDIYNVFWKIKIINYNSQDEGIIKKQVKLSLNSKEETLLLEDKINSDNTIKVNIINKLENLSNSRAKYKDIRKISVGLCKKDLNFSRSKEKSAFYNCFVITLRLLEDKNYKEYHVKIFNTGKLEIPGLQNELILYKIINYIIKVLEDILNIKISYGNNIENVLVNSNFSCNFFINRENLFDILRNKYNVNASYDPCSYPGIQCSYYYDNLNNKIIENNKIEKNSKNNFNNNIIKVSYMIFRTGSILIVGKCNDEILYNVYNYIKNILTSEYYNIVSRNYSDSKNIKSSKLKKVKRKIIYISN